MLPCNSVSYEAKRVPALMFVESDTGMILVLVETGLDVGQVM